MGGWDGRKEGETLSSSRERREFMKISHVLLAAGRDPNQHQKEMSGTNLLFCFVKKINAKSGMKNSNTASFVARIHSKVLYRKLGV